MNPHAARARHEYGPKEVMDRSENSVSDPAIRPPAVAGLFYPSETDELRKEVAQLLQNRMLQEHTRQNETPPRAVLVPHAGYRYSGNVAAAGFFELSRALCDERIVFVLGPPHRVYVPQLALPEARVFRTPLGDVRVNDEICRDLLRSSMVRESAEAHSQEHSLEVELPFLQALGGDRFSVVPLLVGNVKPKLVADIMEAYFDDPRVLYVISTDLSHFLDDDSARRRDEKTIESILSLSATELSGDEACGCQAANGLLELARRKNLRPQLLGFENSSDHGAPSNRVVGYGAVGFWSKDEA